MKRDRAALLIACLLGSVNVNASDQWALLFGLSQPLLLQGGNIEVDYMTEKWVFEYSHGFNLDLNAGPEALTLTDVERDQGLKIAVPYSTGGGIGYRFTPEFNLRLEYKEHEYEVTHPGGEKINYFVQDLGVGAYYFYKPIDGSKLLIVPSLRYWPQLASSLDAEGYTFNNGDVHKAHTFGLFTNVSVGLSF